MKKGSGIKMKSPVSEDDGDMKIKWNEEFLYLMNFFFILQINNREILEMNCIFLL